MTKNKRYIFYILYAIGFLGAGIIGFFSNSFFAYDKFNSLWADIFYILFIALLFVTAFVQEVVSSRAVKDIIVNSAVFLGGLIFILLFYFFGGIVIFLTIIYSGIMICIIGCRFALIMRENPNTKPDMKRILAVFALFMFSMMALMSIEFVDDMLWAWALIPAFFIFIIACAITYLLLKKVWNSIYTTKAKSVGNAICIVLLWFIFAYVFFASLIGIANCVFDGEPMKTKYTVIDKNISSGSRAPTKHEVKVIIDGKEVWIPVSVTEYFEIEEGDTVIIDYYSGAFNFAYYSYNGKG